MSRYTTFDTTDGTPFAVDQITNYVDYMQHGCEHFVNAVADNRKSADETIGHMQTSLAQASAQHPESLSFTIQNNKSDKTAGIINLHKAQNAGTLYNLDLLFDEAHHHAEIIARSLIAAVKTLDKDNHVEVLTTTVQSTDSDTIAALDGLGFFSGGNNIGSGTTSYTIPKQTLLQNIEKLEKEAGSIDR